MARSATSLEDLIHSQALTVQDGPMASLQGFLITHMQDTW
jgi:hypothetical protein